MTETLRFSDAGDASEGELVSWLVAPGDHVTAGALVAEVETDKSLVEVTASVDGVVESLSVDEGSVVAIDDALATIDPDADAGADSPSEAESSTADAASEAGAANEVGAADDRSPGGRDSTETDTTAADESADEGPDAVAVPSGRVFAPPSVRRLAREHGVDITAVDGTGPSGRITADDVTNHATTSDTRPDAAADEPSGPKPLDLNAGDRQSAVRGREGDPEAADATSDESSGPKPLEIGAGGRSSAVQHRETSPRSTTLATPATRRLAEELGVDLDRVPTDETRDGEAVVSEGRLRAYAAEVAAAEPDVEPETTSADDVTGGTNAETSAAESTPTITAASSTTTAASSTATAGSATVHSAAATATVVYDMATVDELLAARDRLASQAADGSRPSPLAFVTKAVAVGLDRYPALDVGAAEADGETGSGAVRVGVATADGLSTTLVEHAADRGVFELTTATTVDDASTSEDAGEDASTDEDAGEDDTPSAGPAVTLTAPGVLGREHVAPAVTDSAPVTLALGAVEKRPVVCEGPDGTADVVAASTIPLSLAVDPSVADGAVAAAFLKTVIERVEDPLLFLTHQ